MTFAIAIAIAIAIAVGLGFAARDETPGASQAAKTTRGATGPGPTAAELNLAQREEFVACAQQREELGMTVGFRDGEAVALPGGGSDGRPFNRRVSVPRAIAAMLEGGGQYVGLREGDGPDVDILMYSESGVFDLVDEERGTAVGGSSGQNSRGQWSHYTTLTVEKNAPEPPRRVSEAISACLQRAAAVFARLGRP